MVELHGLLLQQVQTLRRFPPAAGRDRRISRYPGGSWAQLHDDEARGPLIQRYRHTRHNQAVLPGQQIRHGKALFQGIVHDRHLTGDWTRDTDVPSAGSVGVVSMPFTLIHFYYIYSPDVANSSIPDRLKAASRHKDDVWKTTCTMR